MIIGLTGNIGSGKSTVSRRLAELGAEVIDTDCVARDVVAPDTPGLEKVVREFGPEVLGSSGELDRAVMASIVFNNPGARASLEAIIHPEVFRVVGLKTSDYREGRGSTPLLVVEVPLLIEAGMNGMMDEIWVVTVSPEAQVKRVMARSGLSREDVLKRIKAQMPQEEKLKYADRVIENSGSVEETIRQVDALWWQVTGQKPA
ncbi:MAG: dephospho-CoA kinase [Desulfocucumaceae bacterium]